MRPFRQNSLTTCICIIDPVYREVDNTDQDSACRRLRPVTELSIYLLCHWLGSDDGRLWIDVMMLCGKRSMNCSDYSGPTCYHGWSDDSSFHGRLQRLWRLCYDVSRSTMKDRTTQYDHSWTDNDVSSWSRSTTREPETKRMMSLDRSARHHT